MTTYESLSLQTGCGGVRGAGHKRRPLNIGARSSLRRQAINPMKMNGKAWINQIRAAYPH